MADILLTTLNARYSHCALGLRYLLANMGPLRPRTALREFTIHERPADIAEAILAEQPRVVGLAVYIWNLAETSALVAILKAIRPELPVVIGGPQVSYEYEHLPIFTQADHLIRGYADLAFARLCTELLSGARPPKLIEVTPPVLSEIGLPYDEYTDEDIAHRVLYVEASRGCPFRCQFCLSALDRSVETFELDILLGALDRLHRRGARRFKFVDRTFNLKTATGARILDFFLERLDSALFLHFEVVPDRLPTALRERLARFPAGTVQLEIGIQSFNPDVQAAIDRRQDNTTTEANLRWLRTHTGSHLHADLIAGLPGEDMASFGAGFDRLYALGPQAIQLGILKRLPGAPIAAHDARMRYDPNPPFGVLTSDCLDFATLQRLGRLARYWDLIGNSGRFAHSLPLLAGDSPFARLLRLADWIYARGGQTHRIALGRLYALVFNGGVEELGLEPEILRSALENDFRASPLKGRPDFSLWDPADRPGPEGTD